MKCGMCQRELAAPAAVGMCCVRCHGPMEACDRCIADIAARAPKGASIGTWGIFMARLVQAVLEQRHRCAGATA